MDLFKDGSFIPAVWFWILGSANTEVKEETILFSDWHCKNTFESGNRLCLPVQVYKLLGGLKEITLRVQGTTMWN